MKSSQLITILLAIAVAILLLRDCSRIEPAQNDYKSELDSVIQLFKAKAVMADRQSTILKKLGQDTLKSKVREKAKEIEIKGLRGQVAKLVARRPEIRRDTVFLLQDSIIRVQDAEIAQIKVERDTLVKDFTLALKNSGAQLDVANLMVGQLNTINQGLFKDLNKERRKKKKWKAATIVGIIGGIWLGSKLE